jgi:hypothetical protein
MSMIRAIVIVLVMFPAVAEAADIWVDAANGNNGNDGSTLLLAKKTISGATGAMAAANANDTIKVLTGDYDVAAGETFPILVKDGVQVLGSDSSGNPPSLANYPRIGGDVGDTVDALFVVDATASNLTASTIRFLGFLGENETGEDSPVALQVEVANGYELTNFRFSSNHCERPYQNATGANGRATLNFDIENATATGLIDDNWIEASNRGGVEIIAKVEVDETTVADLEIEDNTITNTGGVSALFGFKYHAVDGGDDSPDMEGFDHFDRNIIRSRNRSMTYGVEIVMGERTAGLDHFDSFSGNIIEGCGEDGLVISADGRTTEYNVPELTLFGFMHNRIVDNGGSGVVWEWDRDDSDDGAGYLHLADSSSNLIADNDDYGIKWINIGDESTGSFYFTNDTIAGNGIAAFGFVDCATALSIHTINSIVWGNTDDIVGVDATTVTTILNNVTYSDWQGLTTGTENKNVDPEFLNPGAGNYHIDVTSLCIDAGYWEVGPPPIDIDRQDRVQDGDCVDGATIDMGCDEVPEDCPP